MKTTNELRVLARLVRMYRGVAKTVGLTLTDVREDDMETGEHYHGFQCEGLSIDLINGEWWPSECHHYPGSIYEPPSVDWETRDSAFASFGDAIEWLVKEAHDARLAAALENHGLYLHYLESKATK